MIDFLKNNPSVTVEQYKWDWTIPQIRIASHDFTHVEYLSEKEAERQKMKQKEYDNPYDLVNDLGIPIFKQEK